MDTKSIESIIQSVYTLSDRALSKITENIVLINYPKGHVLFEADKIEPNIYFIKKGLTRAFCYVNENEVTFWFGMEGSSVISFKNYIYQQPSYENIELLEDSELFLLKSSILQRLYTEDIEIANWGRKLAEQELIKTEERLILRQFKTASDRYHELINSNPNIIKRIQLGYIASYLGITQVSLSRIRANKK